MTAFPARTNAIRAIAPTPMPSGAQGRFRRTDSVIPPDHRIVPNMPPARVMPFVWNEKNRRKLGLTASPFFARRPLDSAMSVTTLADSARGLSLGTCKPNKRGLSLIAQRLFCKTLGKRDC